MYRLILLNKYAGLTYRIYPKYLDRLDRVNIVDPDQTPQSPVSNEGQHHLSFIQQF